MNRVNTEGYKFPPPGTSMTGEEVDLFAHYTLLPFQLVCHWERADGQGYRTTYIDLGTPLILLAIAGLAIGGSGLLVPTHESRGRVNG